MDLHSLTQAYVNAFDACDLDKTIEFFSEEFVLEDPTGRFVGREDAKNAVQKLFQANESQIDFKAVNIYVDEEKKTSVIEFTLKLSSNNVKSADIINWGPDGKMSSIRAYVY